MILMLMCASVFRTRPAPVSGNPRGAAYRSNPSSRTLPFARSS